ncbi:MAG: hypothetical protein HY660_17370 [Armatimonadetes bacterium]|nr:hypothetical protein [Armatimonadota bacterium]
MDMRWKGVALVLIGLLIGLMTGAVAMAIAQGAMEGAKNDVGRASDEVEVALKSLAAERQMMQKMSGMKMTANEKEMMKYLKQSWTTKQKTLEAVKFIWSAEKKMADHISR